MAAILTAVRKSFDVAHDAEITFEANPDSITPKLLRRLHGEGFNRVVWVYNAVTTAFWKPSAVPTTSKWPWTR